MIATLLSTFFGVGLARFAPGTLASAVALPFAWLILRFLGPVPLVVASIAICAVGVWSCGVYAARTGKHDPSECVIDEVAGQWLACAAAPLSPAGFLIAFLLFRIFDVTKIWPISAAERLPGGAGIMADDMVAGLFAGAIIAALRWQGLV